MSVTATMYRSMTPFGNSGADHVMTANVDAMSATAAFCGALGAAWCRIKKITIMTDYTIDH